MIQDAVTVGLPPKQSMVICLGAVIEAATSAVHGALDGEEKSEARQQTAQGHSGSTVTNPTVSEIEAGQLNLSR